MQRLGRSLLQLAQTAGLRAEAGSSSSLAARWSSSAAASAAPPADLAGVNPLNRLQAIKRSLRPDTGRNAFRRAWAKQLQIKWDAQQKAGERAAARQRKHAAQLEKIKRRSAAAKAATA